ncbi:MAG: phage portal protein [Dehalococcoidales bacterium]|jgi:hypothetical protein|nr:phage portal protein [Dehalococcoidales bacterium]
MGGQRKPAEDIVKSASAAAGIMSEFVEISKSDYTLSEQYNASLTRISGEIYNKPFDQLQFEMMIRENLYASQCVTTKIEATVGKGFVEDGIPENILKLLKKLFPKATLDRLCYDLYINGEFYSEFVIKGNQLVKTHHLPACTMTAATDKVNYYQYYGIADKQKKMPAFDMEAYLNKKLPAGSYVFHSINYFGNSVYGIPSWIGAYDILKIMDNAEKDILAYYDNDAIAKTVMMLYNIGNPDKQINKDLKSFLEKNFQGVTNRHKLWILSGLPRKSEGQIDFHELNKNIVDANYLALAKENKVDTCVAFGVPIELLGVSSAGKLGNTQEIRNITIFFNDNKILPEQQRFIDMIQPFFPGVEIKLKQMKIPEVDENEQPLVMQQKSQDKMVEQFQSFMMMLAQYVVENEEK